MLKSRILPIATCCLGLALLVSSSGWFGNDDAESTENETSEPTLLDSDLAPAFPDAASVAPPQMEEAPKGLTVGARFPYLKVVEQTVTQHHPNAPRSSHSRLAIGMVLEVLQTGGAQEGDVLMGVRYENVKLTQDLPGQEVDYDSDRHRGPVPPQAQAYHGLPHHGFSFRLDGQNRLRNLEGFQDFLQACLQHTSAEQRTAVWKSLNGTTDEEHLADFVDDSIGLLRRPAPETGHAWHRERQIRHPAPVVLRLQYTVDERTESSVDVVVGGTIVPQDEVSLGGAAMQIRGGRITGRYTINRHTGLPQDSRVEQVLEMVVRTGNGESFAQTKQTITRMTPQPNTELPGRVLPYAAREKDTMMR